MYWVCNVGPLAKGVQGLDQRGRGCRLMPYTYTYIRGYIYIYTYIHTLHYITLHYTTLHYTTLHYITLHYITYINMYISGCDVM